MWRTVLKPELILGREYEGLTGRRVGKGNVRRRSSAKHSIVSISIAEMRVRGLHTFRENGTLVIEEYTSIRHARSDPHPLALFDVFRPFL